MIISLDLGTRMGFAVGDPYAPHVAESGVWQFPAPRNVGPGTRYLRFGRQLSRYLRDYSATLLVWEEVVRHPAKSGAEVAHVFGGFRAVAMAQAEALRVPYLGVNVGTLKRHATGKGNARKEDMILNAQAIWGRGVTDDNEADALWLLDFARANREAIAQQCSQNLRAFDARAAACRAEGVD